MRRQSAQAKRNEKALKRIKEEKQEELETFLRWLTEHGLEFHLDDDPSDIEWAAQLTPEQLAYLHTTHATIWRHFTSDQIWEAAGRLWNIGGQS